MNIEKYLERIDYRDAPKPDRQTLERLQQAHMLAVPFENLSIHYGEPIMLDSERLYDKIVKRRRGGFCYELNTLFAELLAEIGFKVSLLSAQVATADGGFGPEFDHMALRVDLDEPWLVDVGFGDSFRRPLRIRTGEEQPQDGMSYRIDQDGDRFMLKRRPADAVDTPPGIEYRFGLQPHMLGDFAEMCRYHQTSPLSHFTRKRICSRATPNGRISLSDLRLIVTEDGHRTETELAGEAEFRHALHTYFSIIL